MASSTGYTPPGRAVDVSLPRVVAAGGDVASARPGSIFFAVPEPWRDPVGIYRRVDDVISLNSCVLRVDPGGAATPAPPQDAVAVAAPPFTAPPVAAPPVAAPPAVMPPAIVPPAAASPVVVQAATPAVGAVGRRAHVNLNLGRVWPIPQLPFQDRSGVTELVNFVQAVTRAGEDIRAAGDPAYYSGSEVDVSWNRGSERCFEQHTINSCCRAGTQVQTVVLEAFRQGRARMDGGAEALRYIMRLLTRGIELGVRYRSAATINECFCSSRHDHFRAPCGATWDGVQPAVPRIRGGVGGWSAAGDESFA